MVDKNGKRTPTAYTVTKKGYNVDKEWIIDIIHVVGGVV
jgi:hypothetical protein